MSQPNQNPYTPLDENQISFFDNFGKWSSQFLAWLWDCLCNAFTLIVTVVATALYVLNTPFRVCMGWLFGKIIMPAQQLYQRNASLNSRHLFFRNMGDSYPSTLVFFMHGNAASIEHCGGYDFVDHLDSQLRNQLGKHCLIAFDPVGVNNNTIVYSQEQIISGSYEFIMDHMVMKGMIPNGRNLVDENPMKSLLHGKKVVLVGWSLGGATLTQVANRLHENGIAVKCLADRSFTNLPDVVIGWVSRLTGLQLDCMPMAFARAVVSQLLYHSFGEMDAGSAATALNRKQSGSMHTIRLPDLNSDEVISEHASLSNAVEERYQHTLPSTSTVIQGHCSNNPAYVAQVISKMCQ